MVRPVATGSSFILDSLASCRIQIGNLEEIFAIQTKAEFLTIILEVKRVKKIFAAQQIIFGCLFGYEPFRQKVSKIWFQK